MNDPDSDKIDKPKEQAPDIPPTVDKKEELPTSNSQSDISDTPGSETEFKSVMTLHSNEGLQS